MEVSLRGGPEAAIHIRALSPAYFPISLSKCIGHAGLARLVKYVIGAVGNHCTSTTLECNY